MLHVHEDQSKNVIQVEGITCVGVPIGSPEFVTAFVKTKTSAMVDDVRKLRVLSDPLTHTRLVRFCHNTSSAISIATCRRMCERDHLYWYIIDLCSPRHWYQPTVNVLATLAAPKDMKRKAFQSLPE